MPIEITISRNEIDKWNSSVCVGIQAMQLLHEKGAPVGGAIFPTRVERGRITITEDAFGDLVVTWDEG